MPQNFTVYIYVYVYVNVDVIWSLMVELIYMYPYDPRS